MICCGLFCFLGGFSCVTLCLGFPSFCWCARCYFKSQNGCQWTELDFSGIVHVCGHSKKCVGFF